MGMPNQDWLEKRLSGANYIPDDGFTARVASKLPQRVPRAVDVLRRRVLMIAISIAFALLVILLIPVIEQANAWFSQPAVAEKVMLVDTLAHRPRLLYEGLVSFCSPRQVEKLTHTLTHQPELLVGAGALFLLASLGLIAPLRRWI